MLQNEHLTLGMRRLETFKGEGLGSFVSRLEGWARKKETGESLDSVRAVLVKAFKLDAVPELGTQGVVVLTTRGLADLSTGTNNSGNCRLLTHVAGFDEARETVAAVSIDNSEGGFPGRSVLRAFDSSLSVRELRVFLWSSRGIKTESGFNELGRVWERVI
ncbi:hypothetical protein F5887DRAFT_227398 [Amanita rubescens]|nr:hypothetical protein F5887DRAFT_246410 [Amanita rubescens]KAF8326285.1 hypothetical protein F5887DRAFT_227398 [Amanita rubescens]